jgi:hypothetical protein
VVDPSHPLYGKRFVLVSVTNPARGPRHAMVIYKKDILLRIPLSATSLAAETPRICDAKVSADSLHQLINVARNLSIIPSKVAKNES